MSYYLRKYNKKYKRRHRGQYLDLTKTNVNVSKKSKAAKAYDKLTSPVAKKRYKQTWAGMKRGARTVKGYVQGANDGLDQALGIPQKEKDFGLVTKVPKGYKLIKKRKVTKVPKGFKLVKVKGRKTRR